MTIFWIVYGTGVAMILLFCLAAAMGRRYCPPEDHEPMPPFYYAIALTPVLNTIVVIAAMVYIMQHGRIRKKVK